MNNDNETTPARRSETLYCTEGGADKQYSVTMHRVDGGLWMVICYNGRRGGTQTPQVKTPAAVLLAEAERLYARIFREKLAKGYVRGEAAPAVALPGSAPAAPPATREYQPMLLNAIGPAEAEKLLADPLWLMQQKADGVRAVVTVAVSGGVAAVSRTGKPVALTAEIASALLAVFEGGAVIDTEVCGASLVIFDVLDIGGVDFRPYPCETRADAVDALAPGARPCLSFIQTARTGLEKRLVLAALRAAGAEGVVFKRRTASYSAGRPNSGGPALKWKFIATASVRVLLGGNSKRSVEIGLADGTRVGSVTIPPNHKVPAVGAVIEVEYLYAMRGGSLIQAVYKGVREDVEPDTAAALQYKGEAL